MDSSCAENSPVPLRVAYPYPPPLDIYDNIVASRQLFMDTLQKFHDAMQTKFRIPVIGGKLLDLYRLFVEVTTRGGLEKVVAEKKWKEVKLAFSFPSSATNASFLLKKHYNSLVLHYERVYYSKATHWNPSLCDPVLQQQVPHPPHPEVVTPPQPQRMEITVPEASSTVSGVIDGKFENEYLITVKSDFKGFFDDQVPMNHELQNQKLPTSTTAVKLRIAKLTPRRKKIITN